MSPKPTFKRARTTDREAAAAGPIAKPTGPTVEQLLAQHACNPLMPMFLAFRDDLDEHHDRRERVIKTSRDVTALSKKVIFSLQRCRALSAPLPEDLDTETSPRLAAIDKLLTSIAPDLQALNAQRYARNISSGLQELVEALCFRHYLTSGTLLTHAAAQAAVPHAIELTVADYVLGVFDFVGEVMRFGVTMVALSGSGDGDGGKVVGRVVVDLRQLRDALEGLDIATVAKMDGWKEVAKKLAVMQTCVEKVENAIYTVVVRGSEMPMGSWAAESLLEVSAEAY